MLQTPIAERYVEALRTIIDLGVESDWNELDAEQAERYAAALKEIEESDEKQ